MPPIIKQVTCKRCGFSWYPRGPEAPERCANQKCRSAYWDKPPRNAVTITESDTDDQEHPTGLQRLGIAHVYNERRVWCREHGSITVCDSPSDGEVYHCPVPGCGQTMTDQEE